MVCMIKISVNSLECPAVGNGYGELGLLSIVFLSMFLRHLTESGKHVIVFVAGILL
jgi:hypothetical protein